VIGVEVLCELWRPTSAQLTGRSCDGDGLDLDVDLGDERSRCRGAEGGLERGDRESRAVGAVNVERCSDGVRSRETCLCGSSVERNVNAGDYEKNCSVCVAGLDEGRRCEDTADVGTNLCETTNVNDVLSALDRLTNGTELARCNNATCAVESDRLDVCRIDVGEEGVVVLGNEELEDVRAVSSAGSRRVGLDQVRELRIELEELAVSTSCESSQAVNDGCRIGASSSVECARSEECAVCEGVILVNLGERGSDEVVLATSGERSRADALAGGVVVDRLA